MASSAAGTTATAFLLLVLTAVFVLLSASPAAARPGVPFHPCNTLFITYTISTTSSSLDDAADSSRQPRTSSFVSMYRIITHRPLFPLPDVDASFYARRPDGDFDGSRPMLIHRPELLRRHVAPAEPSIFGFSSLQERAKDILVVVAGLLFGVGCGALTAATMYLAWSLVTNRYEISGYGEEEEDEVESPKKAGYVKIPGVEPAPAKEGYEGN